MKLRFLVFTLFGLNTFFLQELEADCFLPHEVKAENSFALPKPVECQGEIRSCNIGARYVQGAGVGYERGYTTLEAFLGPARCFGEYSPYLDLRGHIFNNGKAAANAGLGVRYIGSIVWGANAYYDYRKTSRYHYNQIGIGVEAIGSFWSLNLNGYLPVGKKKTDFFDASIRGVDTASFAFFQGNQIFLMLSGTQALTAKQEFAFKGIDANAAFRLVKRGIISVDFGLGPYYFDGYYRKYAIGGKGNLSLRISDIFSIGLLGSYDNLFHARVQGMASISIPFGSKNFRKSCKKSQCPIPSFYDISLAKGPDRSEIMVVDRHEKILAAATPGAVAVAINPLTGQPYFIWFVSNTSSSDGTFESPFSTLADAQSASGPNDLIYVFPGDGSDTGMNAGITLLDAQQLIGSGAEFSLNTSYGTVTIPAQSSSLPLITNAGATAVTLANNNVVSGLHLSSNTTGISGSSITGVQILSCFIESDSNPVFLNEFTGNGVIQNNNFSNYSNTGLSIFSLAGTNSLTISSNTFSALASSPSTFGINASISSSCVSDISILNNTLTEHGATGINLSSADTSNINAVISSNQLTAPIGIANSIGISVGSSNSSNLSLSALNNTLQNHTGISISGHFDGSGTGSYILQNNSIEGIAGTSSKAIALDSGNSSSVEWTASILNNSVFGGFTQADIYLDPQGTSNLTSAIISGNTTIGSMDASCPFGIQLDADQTAVVNSLIIANNQSTNHTSSEIAVTARGTAAEITTLISGNTLTANGVTTNNGIQVSASNASIVDATISSNTIIDLNNTGISLSSANISNINAVISSNQITAPVGITNSTGISFSSSNSSNLSISALNNTLQNHTGISISGHFDGSGIGSCILQNNSIEGIAGTSLKAISLDSGNSSSVEWTASILSNSVFGGFTEADIYLDPQGTSTLTRAIISGNTTSGSTDASCPFGIQLNADQTAVVNSLVIANNQSTNHTGSEIAVMARGTAAQITTLIAGNTLTANGVITNNGVQVFANNAGIIEAIISNNTYFGQNGTAIQASSDDTATLTALISNNELTAPLGPPSSNGIVVGADGMTTNVTIKNNTCSQFEGFSIQVNYGGSSLGCLIEENTVTTGNLVGSAFGIIVNSGGVEQTVTINHNTVSTPVGHAGSQFGIIYSQFSANTPVLSKEVAITNNTVINCGNATPLFGFTTGIGVALQSADNLFADVESNIITNCAIGGIGGGLGARIQPDPMGPIPGFLCWKLHNNNSNTDYSLYNNPNTASDFNLDTSGNTGTVNPVGGSLFTTGSCP